MGGLRVTVLGCAGSYPGPGTACSGYLVEGGGVRVVLDLGPGSLANLQQHIRLDEIDAVILSHSHPDHWVDLTGLQTALKYMFDRSVVPVFGTEGTRRKAEGLIDDIHDTAAWTDTTDGAHVHIGGLHFDFSATDHYVDTLAVRVSSSDVEADAAFAYSADTGPGWSFAELGSSIALGLCEATNLSDGEGEGVLHLSARQAGAMSRAAGVERLVLTHLLPGGDPEAYRAEGSEAFGGPVDVATIHAQFHV